MKLFSRRPEDRIIDTANVEVNGRKCARALRSRLTIALVLCLSLVVVGCADEEQLAQRAFEDAVAKVDPDRLDETIERFERVKRDHPNTRGARLAEDKLDLYRNLIVAEESYAWEVAEELLVKTARALDSFKRHRRGWPDNLDELRPKLLDESPVDPWGRPLQYRRTSRGYILACLGADGMAGGSGDAADLYVENGRFERNPSETFR